MYEDYDDIIRTDGVCHICGERGEKVFNDLCEPHSRAWQAFWTPIYNKGIDDGVPIAKYMGAAYVDWTNSYVACFPKLPTAEEVYEMLRAEGP